MPRLDNSHPDVEEEFDYRFDHEDPGSTNPIDVCADCADRLGLPRLEAEDHPPYEELDYTCDGCGIPLTKCPVKPKVFRLGM